MFARHHDQLALMVRLLDAGAIWLAAILASEVRFASAHAPIHLFVQYFGCAIAFIVLPGFDLYSSWRGRSLFSLATRLLSAWSLVWLISILLTYLLHQADSLSRLWMVYWYAFSLAGLLGLRVASRVVLNLLRVTGANSKRVLIVGYGRTGQEMYRRATASHATGFKISGIYAPEGEPTPEGRRRITDSAQIPEFARDQGIDEIWLTLPMSEFRLMQEINFSLRNDFIDIKWMPSVLDFDLLNHNVGNFLGMPAVEMNRPPALGVRGTIKAIFDRTFAALVLIALSPLFLIIGLLIKRDSPGPVFFKQERLGMDGRVIHVYKFRSMKVHAEHGSVTQATKGDSRITPIGAFLRRTSLDELPQFINVLRGEMSVVGPRPHAMAHNNMYKEQLDFYMMRHRVKPGITGWAQINGYRGETDTLDKMAKRVEHDIFYIRNWSFWMDVRIIFWTAFKGWTGRNAY
ncbi:colanic biosynthesis UDP-glucose lipid carrier transferase WcaJ [Cupriavidus necator N-1]|uniref:Colanic biosynthesis UDP-glucose lipid carrier transferase WcaJ n=1 Tax=Cupriavidus necator (strain ATCC 43291 / DSM 13513 / CCUG 52238 / LMG 8453 / N-1) TaxID=1042878 RepID=F8GNI4_CUPNN|nr:undecaprenyl-phosphate glucose phosphotransferase [Cupriavidus necator]AEI80359.1 colanic biosynthesis UDP-glucose lipid carrier transferase WcaJ [Cupriavidus necator N-1]MDX6010013.1 undecaprenyl-phosphate glucose phosphotransferase [Cupriavidus necator]